MRYRTPRRHTVFLRSCGLRAVQVLRDADGGEDVYRFVVWGDQ